MDLTLLSKVASESIQVQAESIEEYFEVRDRLSGV